MYIYVYSTIVAVMWFNTIHSYEKKEKGASIISYGEYLEMM